MNLTAAHCTVGSVCVVSFHFLPFCLQWTFPHPHCKSPGKWSVKTQHGKFPNSYTLFSFQMGKMEGLLPVQVNVNGDEWMRCQKVCSMQSDLKQTELWVHKNTRVRFYFWYPKITTHELLGTFVETSTTASPVVFRKIYSRLMLCPSSLLSFSTLPCSTLSTMHSFV